MAGQKEVRIVPVILGHKKTIEEEEQSLAWLLNDGWTIVAAGGGIGKVAADIAGFVVLEREKQPIPA